MPSQETLERFIAKVESNAHDQAAEQFYAENVVTRENQGPSRVGRALHVANERAILAKAKSMRSTCVRPALVNGDTVVIRWVFVFEWRDGSITTMEELAYSRWQGEQIVEEQFFYDPAQRVPKRST